MADYKDYYDFGANPSAFDNTAIGGPAKTGRVQRKITQTHTYDFGRGPFTVDDILEFAEQIRDLPGGAKLGIRYHDSQMDGESFKITITVG